MRKKSGSEKSLKDNIFKAKIGSTDKKNPVVSYIDGGVYIIPTAETIDFKNAMKNIAKEFENEGQKSSKSNTAFTNNIIFCYDSPYDRMKRGKKSFITFQYYFHQTTNKNYDEIMNDLSALFNGMRPSLIKHICDEGFKVYEK